MSPATPLKKDDLSTVYETWTLFKNFSKKDEDTMEQFLSNYDKSVKELKTQGIVLPEVVLSMQLLDCAKLSTKDIQIVLTAVDYTKKDEMYEQMKPFTSEEVCIEVEDREVDIEIQCQDKLKVLVQDIEAKEF